MNLVSETRISERYNLSDIANKILINYLIHPFATLVKAALRHRSGRKILLFLVFS